MASYNWAKIRNQLAIRFEGRFPIQTRGESRLHRDLDNLLLNSLAQVDNAVGDSPHNGHLRTDVAHVEPAGEYEVNRRRCFNHFLIDSSCILLSE